MYHNHSLEKEAVDVSKNTANPPFIYQLPIQQARETLEKLQNSQVDKLPCVIEDREFDLSKELSAVGINQFHKFNVKFFRPEGYKKGNKLALVFYTHGAGWSFGSAHSHEKLLREICYRTNSIVCCPEYTRTPDAKYPVQNEQCYALLCRLIRDADKEDIDTNNIILGGDSAGGNMCITMALMSKARNGPQIKKVFAYYPAIDSTMSSGSYKEFAKDFYLSKEGMTFFWDNYIGNPKDASNYLCSPTVSTVDQLRGFPDTMILNGECDVLRDEGEAFARKLREAGVNVTQVRFQGMIHDFVMLNSLDKSKACRAAMDLSTDFINKRSGSIPRQ